MSNEPEPMRFVVEGTTPGRDIVWLSAPDADGFRNLVPLRMAEQFQNKADAQLAIANLPRPFRDAGFFFGVVRLLTEADKKRLHEVAVKVLGEARASEVEHMLDDRIP
jgi:hypothetical protein